MTHALVELAKAYEQSLIQPTPGQAPIPMAPAYPGCRPQDIAAKLVEFAHSQYKLVEVSLQLQRDKLDEEIRRLTLPTHCSCGGSNGLHANSCPDWVKP